MRGNDCLVNIECLSMRVSVSWSAYLSLARPVLALMCRGVLCMNLCESSSSLLYFLHWPNGVAYDYNLDDDINAYVEIMKIRIASNLDWVAPPKTKCAIFRVCALNVQWFCLKNQIWSVVHFHFRIMFFNLALLGLGCFFERFRNLTTIERKTKDEK